MAYYKCGTGNSAEVLIDGVEVEEDIKLKSLGLMFKPVTTTLGSASSASTLNAIGVFADNNGFNSLASHTSSGTTYTHRYMWNGSRWVEQSDTVPNAMNLLSNFARVGNYTYFLLNTSNDTTVMLYRYANGTYTKMYTASVLRGSDYHTLLASETDANIIYLLGAPSSTQGGVYQKMYKYDISANTLTEVKNFVSGGSYNTYATYYKGVINIVSNVSYNNKHYTYTDNAGFKDVGVSVPYLPPNKGCIFADDNYLYLETRAGGTNGFGMYRFDGTVWTLIDNITIFETNEFSFKHNGKLYAHRTSATTDGGRIYEIITKAYERVE